MDEVIAAIARHGNVWTLKTNSDMQELYEPLHAPRAAIFGRITKVEQGLKYGPAERNRLDVYSPFDASASSAFPVVVFFHGGGFVAGDNDITPSMHGHIGNFFATKGYICVLATYRVVPEAKYPSGGEDVTQALKWVKENITSRGGNPEKVTAAGQSSGGAHLANALFTGKLKRAGIVLKGVIFLSVPLWYDLRQERRKKTMFLYHETESEEEVLRKTGAATFQESVAEDLIFESILVMVGQLDPNEIVDGNFMFLEAYRKKFAKLPVFEVMKGHNHISYYLGLGLEGDKLGQRILDFIS